MIHHQFLTHQLAIKSSAKNCLNETKCYVFFDFIILAHDLQINKKIDLYSIFIQTFPKLYDDFAFCFFKVLSFACSYKGINLPSLAKILSISTISGK